MGAVMIINASPRAPRSNSKRYAQLFARYYGPQTSYYEVTPSNHLDLCRQAEQHSHLLIVFPLYVDAIPSTLLAFLKTLETNPPKNRPAVSVIVNCGFIEPEQNDISVEMIRLFCKSFGYPFGSVLKIGSGEAILNTPFRALVNGKIKKFALSIQKGRTVELRVTMPLPKKIFLKASSSYWETYGKSNGISKEEMATMEIESGMLDP